jgi:hypothetical protein
LDVGAGDEITQADLVTSEGSSGMKKKGRESNEINNPADKGWHKMIWE